MRATLIALILLQVTEVEPPRPPDVEWGALQRLVGRWEGRSRDRLGTAKCEQTWELVLDGKFLQGRTVTSVGETAHEDLAMISYDQTRGVFVLRQFFSEGYVHRYTLQVKSEGQVLSFESEEIENGVAPGQRVSFTIVFREEGELLETFTLSTPTRRSGAFMTMVLDRVD